MRAKGLQFIQWRRNIPALPTESVANLLLLKTGQISNGKSSKPMTKPMIASGDDDDLEDGDDMIKDGPTTTWTPLLFVNTPKEGWMEE